MCGVAGIHSLKKGHTVDPSQLLLMRDALRHRGPDGCGLWISGNKETGFGHQRLSIIDLSESASQPMCNEDGSIWITFNGEIYNYLEIRQSLTKLGFRFKTDHSDTEVIIYAYAAWGTECFNKLRGMFAFAIWDDRRQKLILARDHAGIKPLYYGLFNDKFCFASEIKALISLPYVTSQVNEQGLYDYLSFMCVPAPDTLFSGIKKLPAGHYLTLSHNGGIQVSQYWDVFDDGEDLSNYSEQDCARRLQNELNESVRYHGVSDVPVGVFLSGGLDSSINAIYFNKYSNQPINTFTVGFAPSSSYENEFVHARKIVHLIESIHREVIVRPQDVINFIPDMVRHQDEPIGDPVCIPVYYVSKLAAESGIKACQVGEGSDEIMCGYPFWKRHLDFNKYLGIPLAAWSAKGIEKVLHRKRFDISWQYEIVRRAANHEPTFWSGAEVFPEHLKMAIIGKNFRERLGGYTSYTHVRKIREHFLKFRDKCHHLDWMSYIDLKIRLPELLLMRVDKMAMSVSLETRVPFLDRKFISYALSIPEKFKINKGQLKYILKKAAQSEVPKSIINRRKQGFGMPVTDFAQWGLRKFSEKIIDDFMDHTDYFDPVKVRQLVLNKNNAGFWYLFNLAAWHKHFIRKEDLISERNYHGFF